MICPVCKRDALYVVDTKESKNPPGLRRNRTCAYCHRKFITYEITQEKLTQMQRAFKNSKKKEVVEYAT